MGRAVDVDKIVGAAEIAERLGLAQAQTVHTWRRRYANFPIPIAVLKQAMVWDWDEVEAWAYASGRGLEK